MIIDLFRRWMHDRWTIGELFVDGVFHCYTLEDRVRDHVERPGVKIAKETAIPARTYRLYRRFSPHFKREMPGLVEADFPIVNGKPLFRYVMIHGGAHAGHTEGCPLVGMEHDLVNGRIAKSKEAFDALWMKIEAAWARREIVEFTVRQDAVEWDRRLAA